VIPELQQMEIQARQNNIERLWRSLSQDLTPSERGIIHKLIINERIALNRLQECDSVETLVHSSTGIGL
jgi:hypothetical protein